MSATRFMPTVDPTYGPPVVREPSPAESINTEYGKDETPQALLDLTDEEFARAIETSIGLRKTGWEHTIRPVLLPKPRTPEEERLLFVNVMDNLRKQVKALEDEEIFEATALRNLSPAFDEQPSSNDIDSIMQNLMGSSASSTKPQQKRISPLPNLYGNESGTSTIGHQRGSMNGRF